jgi:hypothetical protein
MLTEDVVINLLCEHLAADGWKIVSRAMPSQRGTDVVATWAPQWVRPCRHGHTG